MGRSFKAQPIHLRHRRSEAGQTLLFVLAATLVLTTSLYSLFSYLPQLNRQRAVSKNYLTYQALLSGAVAYLQEAIRERWVIDTTTGTPLAKSTETYPGMSLPFFANGGDGKNIVPLEGFLVSQIELTDPTYGLCKQLQLPVVNGGCGALPLGANSPWTATINVANVTSLNPLYTLLSAAGIGVLSGIQYTVKRVQNVHYPSAGRGAIFLQITASLQTAGGLSFFNGASSLSQTTVVGYFPREVNTFGLFVANRLRLDLASPANVGSPGIAPQAQDSNQSMEYGDFAIPLVTSGGGSAPVGINFLSPVFVNGDLVLPPTAPTTAAQKTSPVLFGDTVYLGSGAVMSSQPGGTLTPYQMGTNTSGLNATYSTLIAGSNGPLLYGINAVQSQGARDGGLDALWGITPGNPTSNAYLACLGYEQVTYDLSATTQSALVIARAGQTALASLPNGANITGGNSYPYLLALTSNPTDSYLQDYFNPQVNLSGAEIQVAIGYAPGPGQPAQWLPFQALTVPGCGSGTPQAPGTYYSNSFNPKLLSDWQAYQSNSNIPADIALLNKFGVAISSTQVTISNGNQQTINTVDPTSMGILLSNAQTACNNYNNEKNPNPGTGTGTGTGTGIGTGTGLGTGTGSGTGVGTGSGTGGSTWIQPACNCQTMSCSTFDPADPNYVAFWATFTLYSAALDLNNASQALSYDAANQFGITVSTQPVCLNGNAQPDLINLTVQTTNEAILRASGYVPVIQVQGYDVSYNGSGTPMRMTASPSSGGTGCNSAAVYDPKFNPAGTCMISDLVQINYQWGSSGLAAYNAPANFANGVATPGSPLNTNVFAALNPSLNGAEPSTIGVVPDGITDEYQNFMQSCTLAAQGNAAPASWPPPNYTQDAPFSWNFRPASSDGTAKVTYMFDQDYSTPTIVQYDGAGNVVAKSNNAISGWPTFSLVDTCEITAQATTVVGFFVCTHLVIDPRSSPLQIIGTFSVRDAQIDPSAVQYGITWESLFHPDALYQLRAMGILAPHQGTPAAQAGLNCNDIFNPTAAQGIGNEWLMPIWHPAMDLPDLSTLYACLPTALRGSYPSPFTWTSFKPVCVHNGTNIECSYRDENFVSRVISTQTTL